MHKLSYLRNLKNKEPIQLLNPDEELLYVINKYKNAKLVFRDNNVSELTFDIYKNRNGKKVIYYDLLTKNRLLKIDNVHIFVIDGITTNSDGSNEIKTITAKSIDYLLTKKTIPYINSTYKFYDLINPSNTLMGLIMSYLPSWSIESIDAELYDIYRTFDSENENIYNFIVDKVQPAYECVFRFDTINRKIRVDKYDTRQKTDVYLSFNNAIKELNATLLTDRFATALNVKGAGDLDISYVNPMGTSIMYNLDYYMFHVDNETGEYFVNDSMRSTYSIWKTKYDGYLTPYATKLTTVKTKKDELLVLENELSVLQGELKVIENNIDIANKTGVNASTYVAQRRSKLIEISNKRNQIVAKENEIKTIETELNNIHNDLKFENNFTSEQMKTLDFLIDIATVVDENFAISSSMTLSEKQDVAQQLYDKNKRTLDRISKPRYSFNINSTNILFIDKFLPFVNQLELGSEITIRDNNGNLFNPILLEVTIDLENTANIDWRFSESMRLSDDFLDINEILGNVSNTQMTINSKMTQFIEYARNDKANIYNYMNNGLRADVQEITNTINQEVVMNERGITCRLWLANESDYDNKQLKITNNRIMMTKDNWVTAENCFGEFTMPDGTKVFGVVANTIVGNLIISNNLLVENSSGTFSVNKDGMTVTSMNLSIVNTANTARVLINGADGFKIQKKVSSTWSDSVYIDTNGNVNISGYFTGNGITVDVNGTTVDRTFKIKNGANTLLFVDTNGNLNLTGYFTGNGITVNASGTTVDNTFKVKNGTNTLLYVDGNGNLNLTGYFSGNGLTVDSTGVTVNNTFKIKNGTNTLLSVDGNGNLNLTGYFSGNGLTVNSSGVTVDNTFKIKNGSTNLLYVDGSGNLNITGYYSGNGLTVNASGVTVDNTFKIKNGNTNLLYVDASGNLNLTGYFSSNGVTINSSGLTVDSGKIKIMYNSNSVFEVNSGGNVKCKRITIYSSTTNENDIAFQVGSDGLNTNGLKVYSGYTSGLTQLALSVGRGLGTVGSVYIYGSLDLRSTITVQTNKVLKNLNIKKLSEITTSEYVLVGTY